MARITESQLRLKDGRQITFRQLEPTDAETFLSFRQKVALESTNTMNFAGQPLPSVVETSERIASQLTDPIALQIGAFFRDELVGYLTFRPQIHGHPWVAHLGQFGMMILQDYWGNGIAKHLLSLQENHARAMGVTRIEAMVRIKNARGLHLYEHQGFKVEGTRKKAAKINGEFHDEYFIAKLLDDPFASWRPPVLTTDRLILRPIELADAKSVFAYAKNPNICKFTLWSPHQSIQDSVQYIHDVALKNYARGVPEPFGLTLKTDPTKIIGTVGCFWASEKSKSMEMGYALAEEHWGSGLVVEAAREVMAYCFKDFGLKRIQARCAVENSGSRKVMEKIGMSFEGTSRSCLYHRERFWDLHLFAKVLDGSIMPDVQQPSLAESPKAGI